MGNVRVVGRGATSSTSDSTVSATVEGTVAGDMLVVVLQGTSPDVTTNGANLAGDTTTTPVSANDTAVFTHRRSTPVSVNGAWQRWWTLEALASGGSKTVTVNVAPLRAKHYNSTYQFTLHVLAIPDVEFDSTAAVSNDDPRSGPQPVASVTPTGGSLSRGYTYVGLLATPVEDSTKHITYPATLPSGTSGVDLTRRYDEYLTSSLYRSSTGLYASASPVFPAAAPGPMPPTGTTAAYTSGGPSYLLSSTSVSMALRNVRPKSEPLAPTVRASTSNQLASGSATTLSFTLPGVVAGDLLVFVPTATGGNAGTDTFTARVTEDAQSLPSYGVFPSAGSAIPTLRFFVGRALTSGTKTLVVTMPANYTSIGGSAYALADVESFTVGGSWEATSGATTQLFPSEAPPAANPDVPVLALIPAASSWRSNSATYTVSYPGTVETGITGVAALIRLLEFANSSASAKYTHAAFAGPVPANARVLAPGANAVPFAAGQSYLPSYGTMAVPLFALGTAPARTATGSAQSISPAGIPRATAFGTSAVTVVAMPKVRSAAAVGGLSGGTISATVEARAGDTLLAWLAGTNNAGGSAVLDGTASTAGEDAAPTARLTNLRSGSNSSVASLWSQEITSTGAKTFTVAGINTAFESDETVLTVVVVANSGGFSAVQSATSAASSSTHDLPAVTAAGLTDTYSYLGFLASTKRNASDPNVEYSPSYPSPGGHFDRLTQRFASTSTTWAMTAAAYAGSLRTAPTPVVSIPLVQPRVGTFTALAATVLVRQVVPVALTPTGIPRATAFGSPTVTTGAAPRALTPAGVARTSAPGAPTLYLAPPQSLSPAGTPRATAAGSPTLSPRALAVEPVGLARRAVGWGTPALAATLALRPEGFRSTGEFGEPRLLSGDEGVVRRATIGAPTTALGAPTLTATSTTAPAGVPRTTAWWSPTLAPGATELAPTGLTRTSLLAEPTLTSRTPITPAGAERSSTVAPPALAAGPADISPTGFTRPTRFGDFAAGDIERTPITTVGRNRINPAFGTAAVSAPTQVRVGNIARRTTFGTPAAAFQSAVVVEGLARSTRFGTPAVQSPVIAPVGIASTATLNASMRITGTGNRLIRPAPIYRPYDSEPGYPEIPYSYPTQLYPAGIQARRVFESRATLFRPVLGPVGAIARATRFSTGTYVGRPGALAPSGIQARRVIPAPRLRNPETTTGFIRDFLVPSAVTRRRALPTLGGTKYLVVDALSRQIQAEVQLTSVNYSFQQNQAGELSGSISLYDPNVSHLAAQRSFIVVERAGQPYWVGFLWSVTRADKRLTINAQEIWSIFGHRKVRDSLKFTNLDRAAALQFLVSYGQRGVQGDLGIDPAAPVFTGDEFSWVVNWYDRKTVKEAVEQIVNVDPFSFSFEPYWTQNSRLDFRLVVDPVYPRPTAHVLTYPGNVEDYEWESATPSPNFIDAFGGGEGETGLRTTSFFDPAAAGYVRIEGDAANQYITKRSVLSRFASSELRRQGSEQSLRSVSMSANVDPVLGVLRPGHQVRARVTDGGIHEDDDFVIESVQIDVPDGGAPLPGSETVRLSFGKLPRADDLQEGFLFKDNPGLLGIDITGAPTGFLENPILCNCGHPSHGRPYV